MLARILAMLASLWQAGLREIPSIGAVREGPGNRLAAPIYAILLSYIGDHSSPDAQHHRTRRAPPSVYQRWEDLMTELTRRSLFRGAAAAAVLAPVVPKLTQAAAPQVGKQAAGIYRYRIGGHEVTVVTDGVNKVPLPDRLVTNVKKDEVKAMLAASYMDPETFFNPYSPVVVNTGSKLVLIDTGNSEAAYKRTNGAVGQLLTNLDVAGI